MWASSPASKHGPSTRLLLFCVLLLAMSTPSDAGGGLQPSNTPVLSSDLLILHAALVFFMQMGFVSLESGQGRAKNVRNILLKNLVDVLLSGLSWWAVGYAFSSPPSAGGFIGYHNFFDESSNSSARPWFFSWTFALCTGTIVSGCLAERTSLLTYPVYTVVLTAWIHPMIANWAWSPSSWMHQINDDCAFLDFAGGAVVHVSGGLMGLIGAAICGPRLGRFEDGATKPIPGHDMSAVTLGTFFLWFGWYGFNCGSTYLYLNPSGAVVNRVAINMTLAGCASGLTALGVASIKSGSVDLVVLCNGVLSGLVCATAFCGFFTPWASAVLGLVAGGLYVAFSKLLLKLHVDDPLDSSAIHLGSGLLGTMSLAMLAKPEYVEALTGSTCGGFVYTHQGWLLLGMQVLGVVVIVGWTAVWSLCVFYPLHYFGRLRVDQATELAGIDNIEHGGPAYPEFNLVPYTSGSAER